jgi:hypothetical protein
MKQIIHKSMSMLMAVVVLFSTMSFTIDMHYCGNILVETAIFHKAKGCGMEMQNPATERCSIITKNCCSDEHQTITGQDELQLTLHKLALDQYNFAAIFLHAFNIPFETSEEVPPSLKDYPPPNIVRHIYKLDETYLI